MDWGYTAVFVASVIMIGYGVWREFYRDKKPDSGLLADRMMHTAKTKPEKLKPPKWWYTGRG